MDVSWFDNIFTGDGEVDIHKDFDKFDVDSDGDITIDDCPFRPGSYKAKLWWSNVVEPHIKSQITDEMSQQYGDKIVGVYNGKILIPGEAGKGQGDFEFLKDKLQVTQGLTETSATRIAAKIKWGLYGK